MGSIFHIAVQLSRQHPTQLKVCAGVGTEWGKDGRRERSLLKPLLLMKRTRMHVGLLP